MPKRALKAAFGSEVGTPEFVDLESLPPTPTESISYFSNSQVEIWYNSETGEIWGLHIINPGNHSYIHSIDAWLKELGTGADNFAPLLGEMILNLDPLANVDGVLPVTATTAISELHALHTVGTVQAWTNSAGQVVGLNLLHPGAVDSEAYVIDTHTIEESLGLTPDSLMQLLGLIDPDTTPPDGSSLSPPPSDLEVTPSPIVPCHLAQNLSEVTLDKVTGISHDYSDYI